MLKYSPRGILTFNIQMNPLILKTSKVIWSEAGKEDFGKISSQASRVVDVETSSRSREDKSSFSAVQRDAKSSEIYIATVV